MTKASVIIPARYASSRFPGKPLVRLLGKPMILWVAELSAKAVGREHVYVATEDDRIANIVREAGFSALMTSQDALTGTDRLAEAAEMIDYDIYVNVQGDEPLVDPDDIRRCIDLKSRHIDMIVNGFCWLGRDEDPENVNIPKVVTNEKGLMIYMSRAPIPAAKDLTNTPGAHKKQVCIYGLTREELRAFSGFGRKSEIESSEDIEILRFLELEKAVYMFECRPGSIAIDTSSDVQNAEAAMKRALTE